MPRLVVPIFARPLRSSRCSSSDAVIRQDEMRAITDEQILPDLDAELRAGLRSQPTSAIGSITTPLPITQIFPRRRIPDGIRCRTYFVTADE